MFKWLHKWISLRRNKPGSPEAIAANAGTFSEGFQRLKVQHFTAREFLTLGASHNDARSTGYALNCHPPRELWPNIFRLARVLDIIRHRLDAPLRLHSVYRNPRYNTAIGGAPISQHKLGQAADISSPTRSPLVLWRTAIRARGEDIFEGGIGIYDTFVHVDIRGQRANWDRRN